MFQVFSFKFFSKVIYKLDMQVAYSQFCGVKAKEIASFFATLTHGQMKALKCLGFTMETMLLKNIC